MGLLFGFQRPSRLFCFATFATVYFVAGLFRPAGCSFYFSSQSASTSLLRPAGCFESRRRRPVTSAASFRRGAASTSAPRSLSTACCQLSSPLCVRRVAFRTAASSVGRGFYLFAAFAVNSLVDCPISLSVLLSPRSAFRASARASKRGARLVPPPRFVSTARLLLLLLDLLRLP